MGAGAFARVAPGLVYGDEAGTALGRRPNGSRDPDARGPREGGGLQRARPSLPGEPPMRFGRFGPVFARWNTQAQDDLGRGAQAPKREGDWRMAGTGASRLSAERGDPRLAQRRRPWWLFATFLACMGALLGGVAYTHAAQEEQTEAREPLEHAFAEFRLATTLGHLWLEERVTGDNEIPAMGGPQAFRASRRLPERHAEWRRDPARGCPTHERR